MSTSQHTLHGVTIRLLVSCLAVLVQLTCLFESCSLKARQHDRPLRRIHAMREIRAGHTATALPNGMVLVAGGFRKSSDGRSQLYSNSAELFNPHTESFAPAGTMNVARCGHTATLLANGKVLIAGGFTEKGMTASAELFDPESKSFTLVGELSCPRGDATATLLKSGEVLIAGGGDVEATAAADLFDPVANRFVPAGPMTTPRLSHTATLLPDGKVLILGGGSGGAVAASAELFDPAARTFARAGEMSLRRYKHAAILLKDNHTLILGGSDERDWRGTSCCAEIYDWRSGKFTPIHSMIAQRFKLSSSVAQLDGGDILVCGGSKTVEVFDYLMKRFRTVAEFDHPYYYSTATSLPDGSVLILGGYTDTMQCSDAAWIFKEQ
ncbi:MAG TPA: kelch repeat-containing protein [Bacteroidota bacterium]|nr:kelch repeat-containing protein [Bacteroidota bacterium]